MSVLIDGYFVDVVEQEQHELSSDVTAHPVEQGADVADNVRAKPRELTLTNAVISDTPIGDAVNARQGISTKPSVNALDRLEAIWRNREPVTVVSQLKKYESMVLDKLSITKDAKSYGGLIFTAHFIEVIIVKNTRVTVAIPSAGGQRDLGGKSPVSTIPGNKALVSSFQFGDSRTLQLHTMPIGQADGTLKRGINAVYFGPDDKNHQPTNRGNIETYLAGGDATTHVLEQRFQTIALNYPADGYVLYVGNSPQGFAAGPQSNLPANGTAQGLFYVQFRGISDGKPLSYNPSTKQYTGSNGRPVGKDLGNFLGPQNPNGTIGGNPGNSNYNKLLKPKPTS